MWIMGFLGVAVIILVLTKYRTWFRMAITSMGAPSLPGSLPLIGHGHKFSGGGVAALEFTEAGGALTNDLGGITKFWLGPILLYFVTDPEIGHVLLNTCVQKHYVYKFLQPWLGDGLITSSDPVWRHHRKLLNPTFNQHVLESFIRVFNEGATEVTKVFAAKTGTGHFNPTGILFNYTWNTILKTALGNPKGSEEVASEEYFKAHTALHSVIIRRITNIWLHLDWLYMLTPTKRLEDKVVKVLKAASANVLSKTKAARKEDSKKTTDRGPRLKTFMDLLLDLSEENKLPDHMITAHVDTMITAGHDTTATTIIYLLVLVGSHPGVQEKLYEELKTEFDDSKTEVTKDMLSRLVYTEAVIKETMRLYPVAPVLMRNVEQDIKIRNFTIPAGSGIYASLYSLGRYKAVYGPDAEEFRPDRWIVDEKCTGNPIPFAAFGLGRRSCIGKTFAMYSMKIAVAHVLRKYRVLSDSSRLKVKLDTTLKPMCGQHIALELRS